MSLDNRAKVNKVIRILAGSKDGFYSENTLDSILAMIDTSDRVVDIDEEMGGEFDE